MTNNTRRILPRLPVVVGLAALGFLLFVPDTAQAQGPVLFACYVPNSGVVYRVNPPAGENPDLKDECTGNKHVLFSWNQEGPQGPAGADGAQGPEGPQGPGLDWFDITDDAAAFDLNCEYRWQAESGTSDRMVYAAFVNPAAIETSFRGLIVIVTRADKSRSHSTVAALNGPARTYRRCPSS